ncbi:MAG: hypothetical protein NDI90_03175 [Nitrospira sp. BO4]|nr:hypothetical protein [Nitrospira sp. BO4]
MPPRFTIGQSILWIARQTRRGETQYSVPGHVLKITPKRIAIQILQRNAVSCIRYVTAKRLQAAIDAPPPARHP